MISTWIVGKQCSMGNLAQLPKDAPWDCTVLLMSTSITTEDPIWQDLFGMVQGDVLGDKAVYQMDLLGFIVLHRAKVDGCQYVKGHLQSQLADFITLHLTMNTRRQRMEEISIGILVIRPGEVLSPFSKPEQDTLVKWLVEDRIAVLTGYFGKHKELVATLAREAGAIGDMPVAQWFWPKNTGRSRGNKKVFTLTHPSYFLLFGFYRRMEVPISHMPLGGDIQKDMISEEDCPLWTYNDEGSAFVPNLGDIKMNFCGLCQMVFAYLPNVSVAWQINSEQQKNKNTAVAEAKETTKAKEKAEEKEKGVAKAKEKAKITAQAKAKGKAEVDDDDKGTVYEKRIV